MNKVGIALLGGDVRTVAGLARSAEERGFESVWTTEFYERSAIVSLAAMAMSTQSATVGSGIAYAVGRSPLVLAAEARDLDELSGGRLILGLGTGTRRMQQAWHGEDGVSPAPRVEELVPLLRRLWAMTDEGVRHHGRFYQLDLRPTVAIRPPLRTDIPVYLAGVNSRMIQAAGAVADGLVGHPIFTTRYVEEVARPALVRGAERAGHGRRVPVAGLVICCVNDDEEAARREAKAQIAFYAIVRTYRSIMQVEGFEDEAAEARAAWERRDFAGMVNAISDAMVDRMAVAGRPDEVRQRLSRYTEFYDRILCYPPTYGLAPDALSDRVEALLEVAGPTTADAAGEDSRSAG